MIGFAFEGGGGKGAYQIGVYKALKENNIVPTIMAGTSIGAFNAAMLAQGDYHKIKRLWLNTTSDIFGIDSKIIKSFKNNDFNKDDIHKLFSDILGFIKNKGIDNTKYFEIIKESINEDKLRKSKIKFGLVTVKASRMQPIEITIDDIPKGKVAEYILASSYLPVFTSKRIIDNEYYIDGGLYNNLPLSLCEKNNCSTIYAIKIKGIGFYHNNLKETTKIIEICPKKDLGNILIFDKKTNKENMKIGYLDGLKAINKIDGNDYYFIKKDNNYYKKIIKNVNKDLIKYFKEKYKVNSEKEIIIKMMEIYLDEKNKLNDLINPKHCINKIKRSYNYKDKKINEIKSQLNISLF